MPRKSENQKNNLDKYAKFSGVAFEMLGIIFLGVWGGIKLDARLGTKPLFIIVLSLGAVAMAMYMIVVRTRK